MIYFKCRHRSHQIIPKQIGRGDTEILMETCNTGGLPSGIAKCHSKGRTNILFLQTACQLNKKETSVQKSHAEKPPYIK